MAATLVPIFMVDEAPSKDTVGGIFGDGEDAEEIKAYVKVRERLNRKIRSQRRSQ